MYRVQDLEPGMVLLMESRPGSPWYDAALDAGIRWSTGCVMVHAALVGNGVLINPLWHVQTDPLDLYETNGWAYRVAGSTPAQAQAAVGWALGRVGQQYGLTELLADGARHDLKIPISDHWHPRYVVCSGFVHRAWLSAGVVLSYAPWPTPADLLYSPTQVGARPA